MNEDLTRKEGNKMKAFKEHDKLVNKSHKELFKKVQQP